VTFSINFRKGRGGKKNPGYTGHWEKGERGKRRCNGTTLRSLRGKREGGINDQKKGRESCHCLKKKKKKKVPRPKKKKKKERARGRSYSWRFGARRGKKKKRTERAGIWKKGQKKKEGGAGVGLLGS